MHVCYVACLRFHRFTDPQPHYDVCSCFHRPGPFGCVAPGLQGTRQAQNGGRDASPRNRAMPLISD